MRNTALFICRLALGIVLGIIAFVISVVLIGWLLTLSSDLVASAVGIAQYNEYGYTDEVFLNLLAYTDYIISISIGTGAAFLTFSLASK